MTKRPCYWCDTPTDNIVPMSFPIPTYSFDAPIEIETVAEAMCEACAEENGYNDKKAV